MPQAPMPTTRTALVLAQSPGRPLTPAERGQRIGTAIVGIIVIIAAIVYVIGKRIERRKMGR